MVMSKFTMEMIPRGNSKTTIAICVIIYLILYQLSKFALYVSESSSHAEMQVKNVREEFEENEVIHAIFGNLVPDRNSPKRWTDGHIETTTGATLIARGRNAQVRGLLRKASRPDLIVCDDIEDEESVATPEQRVKARNWFFKSLMPVIGKINKDARIVVLGTLLHKDALLNVIKKDPRWICVHFGSIDRDGDAIWPFNMTLDELSAEKQAAIATGTLDAFYMEYMNEIRAGEQAKFREENFIYAPRVADDRRVGTAIAIDPAISNKPDADGTSIAVVEMDQAGIHRVLECHWERGMTPSEQMAMYFKLSREYNCTEHGVESIAYQASLIHLMKEMMFREGHYFEITPITHSSKKDPRVEGVLAARFANGYIQFARRFPELEEQLLDWPRGKKDAPDAVAMAITLLDRHAPSAAPADVDLGEDEHIPLSKIMGGDWRTY